MMTIYDIAREAGVAASTVSRVVNGKPGVKEETRRRILALLEKYHYSPDAAARGLVKQSTRMVGILIEDAFRGTLPYFLSSLAVLLLLILFPEIWLSIPSALFPGLF